MKLVVFNSYEAGLECTKYLFYCVLFLGCVNMDHGMVIVNLSLGFMADSTFRSGLRGSLMCKSLL